LPGYRDSTLLNLFGFTKTHFFVNKFWTTLTDGVQHLILVFRSKCPLDAPHYNPSQMKKVDELGKIRKLL
jgi:hypothetical protein